MKLYTDATFLIDCRKHKWIQAKSIQKVALQTNVMLSLIQLPCFFSILDPVSTKKKTRIHFLSQ